MRMKIQALGSTVMSTTSKTSAQMTHNFEQVLVANMSEVKKSDSDGAIFEELAAKYDIRNATFEEIKEIGTHYMRLAK